jgi:hypothetical protein
MAQSTNKMLTHFLTYLLSEDKQTPQNYNYKTHPNLKNVFCFFTRHFSGLDVVYSFSFECGFLSLLCCMINFKNLVKKPKLFH